MEQVRKLTGYSETPKDMVDWFTKFGRAVTTDEMKFRGAVVMEQLKLALETAMNKKEWTSASFDVEVRNAFLDETRADLFEVDKQLEEKKITGLEADILYKAIGYHQVLWGDISGMNSAALARCQQKAKASVEAKVAECVAKIEEVLTYLEIIKKALVGKYAVAVDPDNLSSLN